VPAIVLAETYAQLRRIFKQQADAAAQLISPWTGSPSQVLPTTSRVVSTVFARAVEIDLGGNIHDALIAETCLQHKTGLVTLDGRQHRIALALGVASTHLLAP
jgi:predicted nucleic acid-binding protein